MEVEIALTEPETGNSDSIILENYKNAADKLESLVRKYFWKVVIKMCEVALMGACVTLAVIACFAIFNGFAQPKETAINLNGTSISIALGGGVPLAPNIFENRAKSRLEAPGIVKQEYRIDNSGTFLYDYLLRRYNTNVLPVNDTKSAVNIRLLMRLTQIVDIDEKSQIMTTNVWLRHEWFDIGLTWDPQQFGGVKSINIPADEIWLPDTILYNNADGDYQITIKTKLQVRHDGHVIWEPPAIYKSFCSIDVEFFPYDTQVCQMKFGPWTEDVSKVDFFLVDPGDPYGNVSDFQELAVDMAGFYESVEWDVLRVTGQRSIFKYPCCEEEYVDITYLFYVRRKTLFYTINLIIPCVAISFLTVLVFYLPCESGEKVALSISILLSLTVFILLLSEIIPPTSLALPLMGKYLLFTMVLVTLSIAVTVLVLFNHFRHPYSYAMPAWVKHVFLDVLPRLILLPQHRIEDDDEKVKIWSKPQNQSIPSDIEQIPFLFGQSADSGSSSSSAEWRQLSAPQPPKCTCNLGANFNRVQQRRAHFKDSKMLRTQYGMMMACHEEGRYIIEEAIPAFDKYLEIPQVRDAMKCVQFISKRYYNGTIEAKMKADWEAVARVLDRLFLMIFSSACLLGSFAILLHAPSLYDTTPPLSASIQEEIIV